VKQGVPGGGIRRLAVHHEDALPSQARGGGGGGTGVVGLWTSGGDEGIDALQLVRCQDELQLTDFVPTQPQAGPGVHLHQDGGRIMPKRGPQILGGEKGGGGERQIPAGKRVQPVECVLGYHGLLRAGSRPE